VLRIRQSGRTGVGEIAQAIARGGPIVSANSRRGLRRRGLGVEARKFSLRYGESAGPLRHRDLTVPRGAESPR
jgi:hypothetical protein